MIYLKNWKKLSEKNNFETFSHDVFPTMSTIHPIFLTAQGDVGETRHPV